jgi:protein Xni
MTIKLLLIDALNLIRRVYAAQPGDDGPERAKSALTASCQSLQRALRECGPTHAACIFDSEEPGWRNRLYPDYKAGRTPMPEDLRSSLAAFEKSFLEYGVKSLTFPSMEADDIIATIAVKVAQRKGEVTILSTDKTFLQLLPYGIGVRDHFGKRDLDHRYVAKKFGITPEQLADFFALSGDTTNNIPGVPLIGPKKASELLIEFKDLDNILSIASVMKGKAGEMLRKHAEEARMYLSLATLRHDLTLGLNLKSLRYESQKYPTE